MASTKTRQEIADILRSGKETVVYKGRVLRTIADIPSESDFALDNPAEAAVAEANVVADIEKLQAELAKLKAAKADAAKAEDKTKVRKAAEDKSVPATV